MNRLYRLKLRILIFHLVNWYYFAHSHQIFHFTEFLDVFLLWGSACSIVFSNITTFLNWVCCIPLSLVIVVLGWCFCSICKACVGVVLAELSLRCSEILKCILSYKAPVAIGPFSVSLLSCFLACGLNPVVFPRLGLIQPVLPRFCV